MYRIINGELIVHKRGERSRADIVRRADNKFSEQALYNYEKGLNNPSPKVIPYLLKGLGATYEEISEPMEVSV